MENLKKWKIDDAMDLPLAIIEDTPDGEGIAEIGERTAENLRNAELICRAVNSHELLVDALKAIEAGLNGDWDNPHLVKLGFLSSEADNDVLKIVKAAIEAATK